MRPERVRRPVFPGGEIAQDRERESMRDDEVDVVHPREKTEPARSDRREQFVQFLVRRRFEASDPVECNVVGGFLVPSQGVDFDIVPFLGQFNRLLFNHSCDAAGVGIGGAADRYRFDIR